ncbi:unnamed protein product [Dracunculus medinensis]|uniref:Phosphoribosylformylglycinamidine cyclo-ligase n=1 Tax=Dracunculus medinensis TaxID=318479 RepID=A0A0N4UGE4_DRAME|nr:unnamed protein product [Dracunculus medinensis]
MLKNLANKQQQKNSVLVLGSGGRESALCDKLSMSENIGKIFMYPGNGGSGFEIPEDLNDPTKILSFCNENRISLIVVGPEDLLYAGIVDDLSKYVPCFGPVRKAARLEWSKAYARTFMKEADIPSPDFRIFINDEGLEEFIRGLPWQGIAIKKSGLARGKGVIVTTDPEEALKTARRFLKEEQGKEESAIVLEEMLSGAEISAHFFVDGDNFAAMPLMRDYKRLLDGDAGENTGGMGAVGPLDQKYDEYLSEIQSIMAKTLARLRHNNIIYKGVLYLGLIITAQGIKMLEYNCRFGDPETQALVGLMKFDLYDVMMHCYTGQLHQGLSWSNDFVCAVVLTAKGYPHRNEKCICFAHNELRTRLVLNFFADIPTKSDDVTVYHAGTIRKGDKIYTNGGRILCVTGIGQRSSRVLKKVYDVTERIKFEGKFYRKDIGLLQSAISYEKSGVSIREGSRLIEMIKCFNLHDVNLASREKIANAMNDYTSIGQDLVAMCANDVLCRCAEPVAFLDYYATGGETAEMPGVYDDEHWDIAGICIGVRSKEWPLLPNIKSMKEGDKIIGIRSSGLHSNGFSLIRKIFADNDISYNDLCHWSESDRTYGEELLKPTRLYVNELLPLMKQNLILGSAHITGGGLSDNISRILPDHLKANIRCDSWRIPTLFNEIQKMGCVTPEEMFKVFNCGIGMVIIVAPRVTSIILSAFPHANDATIIGELTTRISGDPAVRLIGKDDLFREITGLNQGPRCRIAVLFSGEGTNMENLIHSSRRAGSCCQVVVVISDRINAAGNKRAQELGVIFKIIPYENAMNKEAHEAQFTKVLQDYNVDLIFLAGYIRILTPKFVNMWKDRIINLHPSLLPSFPGLHAVRDALNKGVKITGCTIHYVDEAIDSGRIIAQRSVEILENDDEENLHNRIKKVEHVLYPEIMHRLARNFCKSKSPAAFR